MLQPFKIWLRWVLMNSLIASEIRDVVFNFRDRCKVVLFRTHGVMRDSNALVQHFNPACRAARMFPHLPVSRVLMTVGDYDIPSKKKRSYTGQFLFICANISMFLALFPITIQDTLLELFIAISVNGGFIGLYNYSQVSMIGAVLIVSIFAGLILSRESILVALAARKAAIERRRANENMFYEVSQETLKDVKDADEDELDEKIDGSVYLGELDHKTPNKHMKKPQGGPVSPLDGVEGVKAEGLSPGYEGGNELDNIWNSPVQPHAEQRATKPMWAADSIHNLGQQGTQNFIGSVNAFETNRTIAPIKGPPIAASNKRLYGPEIQASKKDISDEFDQNAGTAIAARAGVLPALKPTPSLMAIIESNATLFTGAETARRSLPSDDEDDGYGHTLGKRRVKPKVSRSRRRTQERQKRMNDEGPGTARKKYVGSDEEIDTTPLYYDDLQ